MKHLIYFVPFYPSQKTPCLIVYIMCKRNNIALGPHKDGRTALWKLLL